MGRLLTGLETDGVPAPSDFDPVLLPRQPTCNCNHGVVTTKHGDTFCTLCRVGIKSELRRLVGKLGGYAESMARIDARQHAGLAEAWELAWYGALEDVFKMIAAIHDQLETRLLGMA